MKEYSVLLVASDKKWIRKIAAVLPGELFGVSTAQNEYVALEKASCYRYDAVVAVTPLPLMEEPDFLRRLRRVDEALPVLTFSSSGSSEGNAAAEGLEASLRTTAFAERLTAVIANAERERKRRLTDRNLPAVRGSAGEVSGIIGCSEDMRKILETIDLVRDSDIPILIEGESGTGKDLVARTIHFTSCRRDNPFVPVNCAAIPDALLESELFGHEKGAFTGAVTRRIGKFEQANRGTLFLDEIAEMSPGTQVKLLRAIETGEIERVGGSQKIKLNIRVICATNQDLHTKVEEGTFRRDLYYRVAAFQMIIPPLRQRREDIPLLAEHFSETFGVRPGKSKTKTSPFVMKMLLAHNWEGNVRELANVIRRACLLCTGDTILPKHLPATMAQQLKGTLGRSRTQGTTMAASPKIVPLSSLELLAMRCALEECGGNVSAAARGLGMGRATFYRKAERYNIALKAGNG